MKFYSKRDLWLGILIWASMLAPNIFLIRDREWMGVLISVPILLFIAWIWFGTYYVITDKELKIRSGPYFHNLQLSSIKKIRKSRNPLSSPALSSDRLEIEYGKYNHTYISPKEEEQFIGLLKEKCPELEINISKTKNW